MQQVIADEGGIEVQVGTGVPVHIAKDFGPACFEDIRITAVLSNHVRHPDAWVIERLTTIEGKNGNEESLWVEVCRLPAYQGR